jgi:hypothetical protein
MGMRRLVVIFLVVGLFPWAAPSAGLANACSDVMVETFAIDTKWTTKTLRPRSNVKVTVLVTRPAEDPAGYGVRQPVDGATVASGLFLPNDMTFGWGETDADGKVSLVMEIPRAKPGKVSAMTFAQIRYDEGEAVCGSVVEYGHRRERGFVLKH